MAPALEFRIKKGGFFREVELKKDDPLSLCDGVRRRSNEGTSCTQLLKYAASFSAASPDLEPHTISVMHSRENAHQAASYPKRRFALLILRISVLTLYPGVEEIRFRNISCLAANDVTCSPEQMPS